MISVSNVDAAVSSPSGPGVFSDDPGVFSDDPGVFTGDPGVFTGGIPAAFA